MSKQTFVTGATGFVGSYIVRYLLQKGYQVRALRRKNSPLFLLQDIENQLTWIEGDVNDEALLEQAMDGVDDVYHAAAVVSYVPEKAEQMFRINIEGTANVVNAALTMGVRKLLHVSSIAALGRKPHQNTIDETAQWENSELNSNYAISKFKGECEVWRGIEEGLNAVIINPSVILGAGYWHIATGQFFQKIANGMRMYPTGSTGFVDVRDVARASVWLMESDIRSERFIANSDNWTYHKLFSSIAKHLYKKPPTWKAGKWLAELGWRLDWLRAKLMGVEPILTRETARTVQSTYDYIGDKLQKKLPFALIPIEQCISETAQLYLESQKKKQAWATLPLV